VLLGRSAGRKIAYRLDNDFVLPGADLADGLVVVEAAAPGVDAHLPYFAQLVTSGRFKGRAAG